MFLSRLAERDRDPWLRHAGRMCVELETDDHIEYWLVTIDDGRISAARGKGDADTVIHADEKLFDQIVVGRANALAAALRGELSVAGDNVLLTQFQRLLPGPPADRRAPNRTRTAQRARAAAKAHETSATGERRKGASKATRSAKSTRSARVGRPTRATKPTKAGTSGTTTRRRAAP